MTQIILDQDIKIVHKFKIGKDWLQIGTNWFQTRKGVLQDYILSPYLFNLYAEYIMRNAQLDEAQAGIKIAGRNINNLRYADDTTLMEESEQLKSLLIKVKEESGKGGLKLNIHSLRKTQSPLQRSSVPPALVPDSPLFALAKEQVGQEAAPQPSPLKTPARLRGARGGHSPD